MQLFLQKCYGHMAGSYNMLPFPDDYCRLSDQCLIRRQVPDGISEVCPWTADAVQGSTCIHAHERGCNGRHLKASGFDNLPAEDLSYADVMSCVLRAANYPVHCCRLRY